VGVVIVTVASIIALTIAGQKSDWSPNFAVKPLPPEVVGTTAGPVANGARLMHAKSCLNSHLVAGQDGRRGPELTWVADRLTRDAIVIRIMNGGTNMPAFANNLTPDELADIVAFLETRSQR
jgi:ubiquinol-cytochrome c reductase cytochrome b subunit